MKRFILKAGLFSVTCFVLLNIIAIVYHKHTSHPVELVGWEIYYAIDRSTQSTSATTLMVGESVSRQLTLHNPPPDILTLGTNQAVSVCGQYLIALSALDHNPGIKRVVLAYQPGMFNNDLTQGYTFNYFVRPFFLHPEFRAEMWPLAIERILRRPGACLIVFPLFRYTDVLSGIDYSDNSPHSYHYLSPISIEYVRRLSALCRQRHLPLRIVSTPISTAHPFDKAQFYREVANAHLEDEFAGYTDTVRVVDTSLTIDTTHFKPEYVDANSAIFLKMIENQPSVEADKK